MKSARFTTQLDAAVLDRLRRFAREQGRTCSDVVGDAITAYLDRAELRPAFRSASDDVLDDHRELFERLAR